MSPLICSPAEAVREFVRPGMSLHLAYTGGRPNALVRAIVREFAGTAPRFTVSAQGFVNTQHALVAAGLVERLVVAFAGENYPSPRPNPVLQRALRAGRVTVECWSIGTLTARLMAGALGITHQPVRALRGSGMATDLQAAGLYTEVAAFGGQAQPAVAPLRPDLTLVHGLLADPDGNIAPAPPYGEGAWGALAAGQGVIACVEKIVDRDTFRRYSTHAVVPGHVVRAVCAAPFGSHPYGVSAYGVTEVDGYGEDAAFMAELRSAARDDADMGEWVRRWCLEPGDHAGYLATLGSERLASLRADAEPPGADMSRPASSDETMTLAACGIIRERVLDQGTQVVLSGIGYAHLAAWTAAAGLNANEHRVDLLAELGLAAFVPQPGDPYLFARQNIPTAARVDDVVSILLRDMSGPATRSIGVLGAAEVDRHGNLNSTWTADGSYLLGSGGANDVATSADEIIVITQHAPSRLPDAVSYITAPGHRVSVIVTSEVILERHDGEFTLTRTLGADPPAEVVRRATGRIGWPVRVARDVRPMPGAAREDLATLRGFDPTGIFLRR
jgi:acyl CoA:acetate/3-ketoacid CoA transferase alpha subunit/acyl CoA:acetate/3-ketoacid CoA transferase beta subunit